MAQVVIVKSADEAAEIASGAILEALREKPNLVLGLATGSSPQLTYLELGRRIRQEKIDVSQMRCFALDEYVGLSPNHPSSYRSAILRNVATPLGLNTDLVVVPPGTFNDVLLVGQEYEALIERAGGIDIQILGLGSNGHIGFNEPGSSLASLTRVKTLTDQTRIDNARFFETLDAVPTHCVTQGIGTILRSRRIFLFAFGPGKSRAVAKAVEGPVSSSCPGSAIQLHPRVTVLVDEAAASRLTRIDYYRKAWTSRPDWQRL